MRDIRRPYRNSKSNNDIEIKRQHRSDSHEFNNDKLERRNLSEKVEMFKTENMKI